MPHTNDTITDGEYTCKLCSTSPDFTTSCYIRYRSIFVLTYLQQFCPLLFASQMSPVNWKRNSFCAHTGICGRQGWLVCVSVKPRRCVCFPWAQPLYISAHYSLGERAPSVIILKPTQPLKLSHASRQILLIYLALHLHSHRFLFDNLIQLIKFFHNTILCLLCRLVNICSS